MVYKIGNMADLMILPSMDGAIKSRIHELAKTLSTLYGEHRNIDHDDGGYVLYAEHGTTPDELRKAFDFAAHVPEYVTCDYSTIPQIVCAHYVLNNEYAVSIIMSLSDAPDEIRKEI